ncbi:MAG: ABC transporter ATP-binding protein [Bacteroidales bacterium]|nr:ABC transporter ATP-binding protein [Bacteroidales bacterium]
MLQIINLTKLYANDVLAVNNLNLEVQRGEIYCMLGANGAGKTTTVNMIFNFTPPTSGKILVNDIDVTIDPLAAKKHLAYVSENVMLYENFSAIQNLDYFSRLGGVKNYSKANYTAILSKVGLPENAHERRIKTFSKGMRQKCGIAIAIAKNSDLIILDEPTSGLDPRSAREFMNLLFQLRKEGKTILMTTHDIFRAKEIANKVGIMSKGNLVLEMSSEEIKKVDLEKMYMEYVEI